MARSVDVDEPLEQGQQGENGAVTVGEGVVKAVLEGGCQRRAAALSLVIGHLRGASTQLVHERPDLAAGGVVVAESLAGQDGHGQRVALGEVQQRPPVFDVQEVLPAVLPPGDRFGEFEPLQHRHPRQGDAGGQVTQPRLLIAA